MIKICQSLFFIIVVFFAFSSEISAQRVKLGIDVLAENNFSVLRGKRVGLITNQTGVNSKGEKTRTILHRARGVELVALYTPEHGLDGTEKAGKYVPNRTDSLTGLVAYSLYGPTRKPNPAMLQNVDILVFDMQDIGARSYTYVSTMIRCMEAAAEMGIEFLVLDRPNPLGGVRIEGPGLEAKWVSFVGQIPVPYVHGMTVGELARMANSKGWFNGKCKLGVVPMAGYRRSMTWSDTGLRWFRTSPNIPHGVSPAYYVATGIAGSLSGLELGIGTSEAFEYLCSSWVNAESFTRYMQSKNPGIHFKPVTFKSSKGAKITIDPKTKGNLTAINIFAIAEFNRHTSRNLFTRTKASSLDIFYKVYGSTDLRRLESGTSPEKIVASWTPGVERFKRDRAPFLLYQ